MRIGELFAGIGGFGLGLERAGHEIAFQVEIEPFCQRVLARHWPIVPRFGDIRTVALAHEAREQQLGRVDLLCGGFPCQDVSVAGKRAGLAGERSGLFWEFLRVARQLSPRWLLLENVPGLLSSNRGRDFGAILAGLEDSGYHWAYRILDSQHFGVAQRRRRVFIVGHRGAQVPPSVLFEPTRRTGHPAAGQETRARVAHALAAGAGGSKFGSGRDGQDDFVIADPVTASYAKQADSSDRARGPVNLLVGRPLKSGRNDRHDESHETSITHTLKAEGHDASEDGTGRGVPMVIQEAQTGTRLYESAGSLRSNAPGSQPTGSLLKTGEQMVRRLTATECERLQGFPDGWTCLCGADPYSTMTCRCPDSPRYRALGNAVTVNVIEWIARNLT